MNPLTLILLAFFAYFFYTIGSTFLAFLSITVAIIFALSSPKETSAGGHGAMMHGAGQQPIIVQSAPSASFPRKFEFRPNFPGDPDGDEWISGKLGAWMVLGGRILKKVFSTTGPKTEGHH